MPCESAYLAPTHKEQQDRRACVLLVWLRNQLGFDRDLHAERGAADIYGNCHINPHKELCRILGVLNQPQIEEIVYNAKDRTARDLADWWEDHQEADRKREAAVATIKANHVATVSALNKLTPDERRVLGLPDPEEINA